MEAIPAFQQNVNYTIYLIIILVMKRLVWDEVLFPLNGNSGNAWWEWRAVFDGTDPDDDIYQYIENYDIIIIKTCYTVGIPIGIMAQLIH